MSEEKRRIPIGTPVKTGVASWLSKGGMIVFGAKRPPGASAEGAIQDDAKSEESPKSGAVGGESCMPNED